MQSPVMSTVWGKMQHRFRSAPWRTAYPLAIGADGFYVTSGHSIEVYVIDAASGKLGLARSNTEVYDENGNATYYRLDDQGQTVESTEEEYIKEWDIYSKVASPIEFTVQK